MEDSDPVENIDRLGDFYVSNFRQKSTAEKSIVNQYTTEVCLKFETSTLPTYLYFQEKITRILNHQMVQGWDVIA